MKPRVKTTLGKCSVGFLCAAMITLCGIYVYDLNKIVYYISITAFVVVAVMFCAVDGERYPHIVRTALVAAVLASVALGAYMLYYLTGLNAKFNDFDALKRFIVDSGFWGYSVFVGLTIFQVVVLPVPAALTILLGVAIYGPTVSFILSVIGTVIGSLIAFALGKVFGRKLCNWMFGEDNTDKYARIVGEKGRFLFVIMLLFPAFPDDMLCMIAGITTMTYKYFTVVCVLTRPVMIGLTAYLGSGVIPFSGWGIPVWISIVCVLFVLFVLATRLKTRVEKRRGKA